MYTWLFIHAPMHGKWKVIGPVYEATGKGILSQSPKLSCPWRKHFACFLQGWMRSLHDLLRENLFWFQYNQTTSSCNYFNVNLDAVPAAIRMETAWSLKHMCYPTASHDVITLPEDLKTYMLVMYFAIYIFTCVL